MKNLLIKTLFVSLLLSAVPSVMQAGLWEAAFNITKAMRATSRAVYDRKSAEEQAAETKTKVLMAAIIKAVQEARAKQDRNAQSDKRSI